MRNTKFKTVFLVCMSVLTFNSHASSFANKDVLIKQCRDLSMTVGTLVSSQQKQSCAEKLASASFQLDVAADWIIDDVYSSAKQELDKAVYSLQYAELNTCNRYIQISHSKFEAQKIKSQL